MSLRARIALLAGLAVALPQLAALERGRAPDAGVDDAATPLRLHEAPHPATEATRTSLPDVVVDRFSPSPFAAPAPLEQGRSSIGFQATAALVWRATSSAPVILPLSRAPPALS